MLRPATSCAQPAVRILCRVAALGLARIVDDGHDGLATVVHCLNNRAAPGPAESDEKDAQEEEEEEDVLTLGQFMVPAEVAAVLEPYLTSAEAQRYEELLERLEEEGALDEEGAGVAHEALLTCVNLGLLLVDEA